MDISWNLFLDALSQREEESAFFKALMVWNMDMFSLDLEWAAPAMDQQGFGISMHRDPSK